MGGVKAADATVCVCGSAKAAGNPIAGGMVFVVVVPCRSWDKETWDEETCDDGVIRAVRAVVWIEVSDAVREDSIETSIRGNNVVVAATGVPSEITDFEVL